MKEDIRYLALGMQLSVKPVLEAVNRIRITIHPNLELCVILCIMMAGKCLNVHYVISLRRTTLLCLFFVLDKLSGFIGWILKTQVFNDENVF